MHSDKRNSITAKVMDLISLLFDVALSSDMPFHQPQQLQCLHHGCTKAYLCIGAAAVGEKARLRTKHC